MHKPVEVKYLLLCTESQLMIPFRRRIANATIVNSAIFFLANNAATGDRHRRAGTEVIMFRAAKVVASLGSDWEYAMTADDSRNLGYLLQFHSEIRRLPPTAAAGMFLCHMMKRDYEFTSIYFPEVLINILNLPETQPEKICRDDANKLLAAATAALIRHQHPYLETFAEHLCEPVA